jgi:hypothetical protein
VKDDQREFLLNRFQGLYEDASNDHKPGERLGPESTYVVVCLRPLIAWLRGKRSNPGPNGRKFLEERLDGFEDTVGWAPLAYEHDALMAAIGELK